MATILVADDYENICVTLKAILESEGHEVTTVQSGQAAVKQIQNNHYDIVFTDLRLGDIDGIKLLSAIRDKSYDSKVVLMTAFGSISSTVKAMKLGAYDYLTKPIHKSKIISVVTRILSDTDFKLRGMNSQDASSCNIEIPELVGKHPLMMGVSKLIKEISPVDVPVLILGESGTGKELVARAIHKLSSRSNKPYVAVNCATLPENLQDSELFGHVKGAFTGAVEDRIGLFEQANGGTILLDELGEMSLGTQAKLLRVLEDGKVKRVGRNEVYRVDARVIASTNKDLTVLIKNGLFRADLYFRLNVIRIILPPLRERISDFPYLVDHFINKFAIKYGKAVKGISPEALRKLEGYHWPGNVRELENTIKRAVVLCESDEIGTDNFRDLPENSKSEISSNSIAELEKKLILQTLEETSWNNSMAASRLGISYTTLWRRMKRFGLQSPGGD